MSEKSEKDKKVFQSYLDNIKAKTGKTPDDFRKLAKKKGLVKSREIVAWLKEEYGLGYGHAGAIYYLIAHADDVQVSPEDRIEKLFAGKKSKWRKAYDALEKRIRKFGTDVEIASKMTYINLCCGTKKFAIVQTQANRYEVMVDYWPTADTDPSSPEYMVEFAHIWKNMPKIVFSRTLEQAEWNTRVVRENIAEEIAKLKAQPGRYLAVGGADIAATFMQLGLIDEYWLYVQPVVLGSGTPMFRALDNKINLRVVETRTFGSGVVLLRYRQANQEL